MRAGLLRFLAPLLLFAGCQLLIAPDEVAPPSPAACQPLTCEALARLCGTAPDGCGDQLDCGDCGAAEVCDDAAGACVGCRDDSDCAHSASGERCHPGLRTCVACVDSIDCGGDPASCDPATHRCRVACRSDQECHSFPGAPRCDAGTGHCVECLSSADCLAPAGLCDSTTRACVVCRTHADCPSPALSRCRDQASCVECLSHADCASGGRCSASSTCVQCLTSADCAGASPHCAPQGRCVECVAASDCASGGCDADGRCTPAIDLGESCAAPFPLAFEGDLATAAGDTTGRDDDGTGSCGGGSSDLVYRFTLAQQRDVEVALWPADIAYRPALFVRRACSVPDEEVGCGKARVAGEPATLSLHRLAKGTYFVYADGLYATHGPFTLAVRQHPGSPALPETCSSSEALVFDQKGDAFAAGDTAQAASDEAGSCGGGASPDLAFSFQTTRRHSLLAVASALDAGDLYQPLLFLRAGCTAQELACEASLQAPGSTRLAVGDLPAGQYTLWVDGLGGSAGAFALRASLEEPLGDTCALAREVVFDSQGHATITGSTDAADLDFTSEGCGGSGPDLFYRLTLPANATLTVTVHALDADFEPVLALLEDCDAPASEVDCVQGTGETLTAPGLGAGDYWLVVDGYAGARGRFRLELSR
ncbi:MAG: hypothetical protein HY901_30585 [Deltaproteobacteria bacterium]|nr:hypothetical protein [Deltaproteobacteria bacterium]